MKTTKSKVKLADLNLHDVGCVYQFSGVIYSGGGKTFLVGFPDENLGEFPVEQLEMDRDEWKKFLRQTDHLETEVLKANPENGEIVKAFVRKSTRQIDQNVSWNVYKRDKYTCRYCNREGVPLTVDHLVLWEHGGPSIEDNLNTACRACNKTRGNMLYEDWLKSPYYKKVSQNLPADVRQWNESIMEQLKYVPRHAVKKSR
jgi:hypothetical protein